MPGSVVRKFKKQRDRRLGRVGRLQKDIQTSKTPGRKRTSFNRSREEYLKRARKVSQAKGGNSASSKQTLSDLEYTHKRALSKGVKAGRKATGRIADPAKQRRYSLGLKGLSTGNTRRRAR